MAHGLTRRGVLAATAGLGIAACLASVPAAAAHHPRRRVHALPKTAERRVVIVNAHTNEELAATYWRHGVYQHDVMRHVAHLMRDHYSGDVHAIDPKLLDLLHDLHTCLGGAEPFTLISGYRSPATNAMLARRSGGVAVNSMHIQGRAADIVLAGRSLDSLHNAALHLARGGVGYYPRSDFVHVDTGRVRRWQYG